MGCEERGAASAREGASAIDAPGAALALVRTGRQGSGGRRIPRTGVVSHGAGKDGWYHDVDEARPQSSLDPHAAWGTERGSNETPPDVGVEPLPAGVETTLEDMLPALWQEL